MQRSSKKILKAITNFFGGHNNQQKNSSTDLSSIATHSTFDAKLPNIITLECGWTQEDFSLLRNSQKNNPEFCIESQEFFHPNYPQFSLCFKLYPGASKIGNEFVTLSIKRFPAASFTNDHTLPIAYQFSLGNGEKSFVKSSGKHILINNNALLLINPFL